MTTISPTNPTAYLDNMTRPAITHIVIMDGTLSTLNPSLETNAGLTYRLMQEVNGSARLSLIYEEGIQWCNWRSMVDVAAGRGLTGQIRRAYGALAARYRPGDKIYLIGFSRGAYAVRSLAGVIDRIGLLHRSHATERNIRQIFRYYRQDTVNPAAQIFADKYCCKDVRIEMIGVWDTVKALGIQYPLLWRLAPKPTDFHNHALGHATRNGFQALALNEDRRAFTPVLWTSRDDWQGRLEQAWFRGAHGDVGGHIGDFQAARPLSNIPLIWLLERAETCGLPLPENWRDRFPTDAKAPAFGARRRGAWLFLWRKKRSHLSDPSEYIHPSAQDQIPL
jgi:uncharacterized protein (DUF2235 family)